MHVLYLSLLRTLRDVGIKRLKYTVRFNEDDPIVKPCSKTDKRLDRWDVDVQHRMGRDQIIYDILNELRVMWGFNNHHDGRLFVLVIDTATSGISIHQVLNPYADRYSGYITEYGPELIRIKQKSPHNIVYKRNGRTVKEHHDQWMRIRRAAIRRERSVAGPLSRGIKAAIAQAQSDMAIGCLALILI